MKVFESGLKAKVSELVRREFNIHLIEINPVTLS